MKEDNILVQAALYAYPEYEREISRCKAKLNRITGLKYCVDNPSESFYNLFGRLNMYTEEIDNYNVLKNVVMTAVSRLRPIERNVAELVFFKRLKKERVCEELGLKEYSLRYYKNRTVKSVQTTMQILGMDNAKIIELFDDSALLIRWAAFVEYQRDKIKRVESSAEAV